MPETVRIGDLEFEGLTSEQQAALEALASGATPGDVRGLAAEDIEAVYAVGFNLYQARQYERAEPLFAWACLYGMAEPRYWMALGNCRQALKKYKEAIETYGFCFVLDAESPWPALHCAVCHLAMADRDMAKSAVEMAEDVIATGRADAVAQERIVAIRLAL